MENMKVEYSSAVCAVMFLLVVFFGGCWAACGCRGTSKLYVQYKPPVSGWYMHSPQISSFKRDVVISDKDTVSYFLNYSRKGKWMLWQRSSNGKKIIAVFGSKSDPVAPLIRIFCPAPKCSCQGIAVEGVGYLNGAYYREESWETMKNLIKTAVLTCTTCGTRELLLEEMKRQCNGDDADDEDEDLPLSNLADCVRNETEVFSRTYHEPVVYRKEDGRFYITKAPEGDFWWFEADDGVFAASKEGAPCVENLPAQTQWLIVTEHNRLEIPSKPLNVTCIMDRAFANCSLTT